VVELRVLLLQEVNFDVLVVRMEDLSLERDKKDLDLLRFAFRYERFRQLVLLFVLVYRLLLVHLLGLQLLRSAQALENDVVAFLVTFNVLFILIG